MKMYKKMVIYCSKKVLVSIRLVIFDTSEEIVHYDTCDLSSTFLHSVKLGPGQSAP